MKRQAPKFDGYSEPIVYILAAPAGLFVASVGLFTQSLIWTALAFIVVAVPGIWLVSKYREYHYFKWETLGYERPYSSKTNQSETHE